MASSEGGGEGGNDLSHYRSNNTSTVDGSTMFASTAAAAAVVLETATGGLNITSAVAVNSAEGGMQSGAEEPPASPGPASRGLGDKRPSVRKIWKDGPGEDPNSEQVRTATEQHVAAVAISGIYSTHAASGVTF